MVDASNYRYDLEQSGGATMMDLTVHRIDLIRYLLGQGIRIGDGEFAPLRDTAAGRR